MSVNGAETGCTVPGSVCDCCVCTAEVLLAETHIQLSATERSFMFSRKKWTFAQIVDYCFSILLLFNECSLVFIDIHKMTDMLLPWLCFFCLLLIIVYHSTLNDIFYTIFVSFPCASNLWNTCICIQCCWKRSLTVFEGICTWGLRLILSRTICRLN